VTKSAAKVTAVSEAAAALDTMLSFPLPLYCATTTVPPVAKATKTLTRNIFRESTILTALIAATPEELIIAVLTRLKPTRKAWSIRIGSSSEITCR
jgi:hypothetical protein